MQDDFEYLLEDGGLKLKSKDAVNDREKHLNSKRSNLRPDSMMKIETTPGLIRQKTESDLE